MEMVMDDRVNNRVYKDIIITIINVYIEPDMCLDRKPGFSSLSCNVP